MSAFACANTWLAFVRADQKPNAEEEVTSAREPSGSEDEDDGRPRANFADAGLDKFPIDSQQQRQQDSLSQEDKNERLYERLAELSGQALTEENRSQGIFCPTQGESDEASEASKTSDDDATPPRNEPPATIPEDEKEKLSEMEKEFGPIEYSDNSKIDEERYIMDVPAAIIVGVMIRGITFLTNHRFAFYAVVPDLNDEGNGSSGRKITGTATIHFASSFRPKKRAFLVLGSDSLNAFSSPRRLDQPWGCVHFSTIQTVTPLEAYSTSDQNFLEFTFTSRVGRKPKELKCRMEFDDAVTASHWRNELSAALFQFKNKRDRFRASVPLERIEHIDVQTWGDFAHTASLTIIVGEGQRKTLDIGFLNQYKEFLDRLGPAVDVVRQRHIGAGAEPASNLPTIEISAPSLSNGQDDITDLDTGADDIENDHATPDDEYLPTPRQIERFRFDFGLFGENEDIFFVAVGSLARTIPVFGKLAISKKGVMFSRKTAMINNVKIFLPAEDIKDARESTSIFTEAFGLHIIVRAQEDLALLFPTKHRRDAVITAVQSLVKCTKTAPQENNITQNIDPRIVTRGRRDTKSSLDDWASQIKPAANSSIPLELVPHLPKLVGANHYDKIPRKVFACLTIGSRGDIQPYIALGKGLVQQGHEVFILTHDEYADWIREHGLKHRSVGGDPGLLMEVSVEHKIFEAETQKKFRAWFEALLRDAYREVQGCGAEVLIESPSAFAGVHIAEALQIPFFRAFSMPWTKTGDFPHAFINGPQTLSRAYNLSTYLLFDQFIWRAASTMINRWRKQQLQLPATDLDRIHNKHIATLYFFSENIVPRPLDWPSWVQITGPWILEQPESNWKPPEDLQEFIKKAKEDKKPLVYCGFGSITVSDPTKLTAAIIESVKAADIRLILSKGWSGRMQKSAAPKEEPTLPAEIYQVDSIPHDWLFPQLDAAMHHGGAGTTTASLSAGVPTLIRPFFGDQYFWANRVQLLGAGLRVKSLSADDLTEAWRTAINSRVMKERAEIVGQKIKKEDGVKTAIRILFAYLSSAQEAMKPTQQGTSARARGASNGKSPTSPTPSKTVLVPKPEKEESGQVGSETQSSSASSRQRSSTMASRTGGFSSNWLSRHRSGTTSSVQSNPGIVRTSSPSDMSDAGQ